MPPRSNVYQDAGPAAHDRIGADPDARTDDGAWTQIRTRADRHMSGQRDARRYEDVFSELGVVVDRASGIHHNIVADPNTGVEDGAWTDINAGPDMGGRRHESRWMNYGQRAEPLLHQPVEYLALLAPFGIIRHADDHIVETMSPPQLEDLR